MLDAFIIEEIRRREQEAERRRDQQRPRQELPLPQQPPNRHEDEEPSPDRGVTIIDYSVAVVSFER
jgi:hypothetical protein